MFGRKVECDACNAKLKAKGAIYHRGSYFCNGTCRDTGRRPIRRGWRKALRPSSDTT